MNLSQLREACIADFHHDSIETRFYDYLLSAEEQIRQDVTVRQIERAHYFTLANPPFPIPDDLNVIKRIVIVENGNEHSVLYQSARPVEHDVSHTGRPTTYAVNDQHLIVYPTPDKAYDCTVYYIPHIASLTLPTETNWLLSNASNIYRYAVLGKAAIGMKDWQSQEMYLRNYDDAWQRFQSGTDRARFPLDTPMRIRMRSSTGKKRGL